MEDKSKSQRPVADLSNLHRVGSVARLTQLASCKQQQQRLTKVTTLDDQIIASYTYDENFLRLTKTVGDTTHEYFYSGEVLDMEVVKVKDVVTEYRSYEWNGYTPLGMMVKAKNESGTFETVKEGEPVHNVLLLARPTCVLQAAIHYEPSWRRTN
ncbi:hypothetical protein [Kurthia sibirica]|uniref:Uncharacterized protein n=1 Tax=Kurthia sibirica TaxID=202750 RepID=A0A2U3AIT6_9BACL|nr:hypothetical protein [Kurthia sibirica]PWI24472.1 hypothetical protein DEX24_13500 [Kurthia sibirica]